MMNLNDLRIGYVPYDVRLNRPGDRRRFCYYAKERNVPFEIAKPSEVYDVVIVTEAGDLGFWSRYDKGKTKIIYDLIDSCLSIPVTNLKWSISGVAKFVTRQSYTLQLNPWKAVQEMCLRADAVVCTTEEQKREILRYCGNVHVILDIHSTLIRGFKEDYSAKGVFNFVWEGLPANIYSFSEIGSALERVRRRHDIALHLVTDMEFGPYQGRLYRRNMKSVVRRLFGLDKVYLYEWNESLLSSIINACDLALIPISLKDPLSFGKPENKLLLFWRMGMPAVVSATPAYQRAMERCGLPMSCQTGEAWEETLERYISDEAARKEAGERGRAFAEKYYSEESMLCSWDHLFESILEKADKMYQQS